MLLWVLLAMSVQAAEGPAEWSELYDARLLEVADAHTLAVAENLVSLLSRVDETEPMRGEVAYWLAHARLALGDVEQARDALEVAVAYDDFKHLAEAFASQIDAIERKVDTVPLSEAFDEGEGPLVHSWLHSEWGHIERGFPPFVGYADNAALSWTTQVRDYQDDQVFISFALEADPVHVVRFRARTEEFPAHLRILMVDRWGREYSTATVLIPVAEWAQVEVEVADLMVETAEGEPIHRLQLQAVHIQDVSAHVSGDRGPNVIWFDDLFIE